MKSVQRLSLITYQYTSLSRILFLTTFQLVQIMALGPNMARPGGHQFQTRTNVKSFKQNSDDIQIHLALL